MPILDICALFSTRYNLQVFIDAIYAREEDYTQIITY